MKGYSSKQAKKNSTPWRFLPMKASYQPHECFADLFAPQKKVKLNETLHSTPEKSESPDKKSYDLSPSSQGIVVLHLDLAHSQKKEESEDRPEGSK